EGQDRVLRAAQESVRMLPPWDNSAMDGYAVRAAELPGELPIAGTIAAGDTPDTALRPGTCLKIMTGAPMPAGADAVVMREDVEELGSAARFGTRPKVGENIRRAGEDVALHTTLL